MNVMSVNGYHAKLEYDPELDLFRGQILGLNGGAGLLRPRLQAREPDPRSFVVLGDAAFGVHLARQRSAVQPYSHSNAS